MTVLWTSKNVTEIPLHDSVVSQVRHQHPDSPQSSGSKVELFIESLYNGHFEKGSIPNPTIVADTDMVIPTAPQIIY